MANNQNHKSSSISALMRALKIFYLVIFIISLVVVVLFIVFKVTVKPPEVNTSDTVVVTLPPDTSDTPDTPDTPSTTDPVTPPDDEPGDVTPPPTVTTIELKRKKDFHTFLLLGTDDGNGNADTIMVGSYDLSSNRICVVSVPRDTLVDVSRTTKKLNGAYGMGGVEQVLDELQPILGFRPDHYISIDIQAFVEVVDVLGGVDYYVPEDMFHNDGAGFIIDLKEGQQLLDGHKALQLVRYRGYQNADLGRIQTQQKFIRQLADQVLSWSTVTSINEFAKIFTRYFNTDLTVTELAFFGISALSLDFSSDITFATLPGDGMTTYLDIPYYYELYPEECRATINSTINPYTTDIPAAMTNIFQVD